MERKIDSLSQLVISRIDHLGNEACRVYFSVCDEFYFIKMDEECSESKVSLFTRDSKNLKSVEWIDATDDYISRIGKLKDNLSQANSHTEVKMRLIKRLCELKFFISPLMINNKVITNKEKEEYDYLIAEAKNAQDKIKKFEIKYGIL